MTGGVTSIPGVLMMIISLCVAVHTITGKPNSLHDTEDGEEDSK